MRRLILVCAAQLLLYVAAAAQPTCFSGYQATSYCRPDLLARDQIFVAKVIRIIPAVRTPEDYGLNHSEVVVKVESVIKGEVAGDVRLRWNQHCAGNIVENEIFVFNVEPPQPNSADGNWVIREFSYPIGSMTADERARLINDLRSAARGEHQPRIVGSVTGRGEFPFPGGAVVTAKHGDDVYQAIPDTDGKFIFDELPDGRYKLAPQYPDGWGPVNVYDETVSSDAIDIVINNEQVCSQDYAFHTKPTASITGRLHTNQKEWSRYPGYQLLRADTPRGELITDLNAGLVSYGSGDFDEKEPDRVGFRFDHQMSGRYLLRLRLDDADAPLLSFYYPGVRDPAKAAVVELGPGQHLDLDFDVPELRQINVRGLMQLADGRPLHASVTLTDSEVPAITFPYSSGYSDEDNGNFFFSYIVNRPFILCAAYDGYWHGRPLRVYGRIVHPGAEKDMTVPLKLDRPIPKGADVWSLCRKGP